MANRTITANFPGYNGVTAGTQFTNSTATVDDSTKAGKTVIGFAHRHGWGVSGAGDLANDLVPIEVKDGKPVAHWTADELRAYLDEQKVGYPSGASIDDLRAAVLDAYETKAQGGSAANESAGHTSGSIPPEGAPPVSNPDKPDDPEKAALWHTPLAGADLNDIAPTITTQPVASSKVAGTTATYTVVGTGTPDPSYQWQRQTRGAGAYADIEGATEASYTTPALTVAENNQDRYRVILSNSDGKVQSSSVQQTVTAA